MAPHSMVRPTRARGRVLTFAFLLAVVTYLDRICISAAAPFMMEDLHLTVLEMSAVFSAFTLAYSIFEIPSGWLGDTRGPRRVLTRIVLWWSGFTMVTRAAQGFASLVSIRFLFGAGEAVAGATREPQPLRYLRDVFCVRVWAPFLFHMAADLPDSRPRVLAACGRTVRRAPLRARGSGRSRRRMADRSPGAGARAADRTLRSWLRGVS